jgi:WhiB family redox-sensing transcriptional regulator
MTAKNDIVEPPRYFDPRRWVDFVGGPDPIHLRLSRWQDQGACVNQDTDWFVNHESSKAGHRAKRICATCPVRRDCLAASLIFFEEFGIWGGLDRHQRKTLAKKLRRGAKLGAVLDQALGSRSAGTDAA